MNEIYLISAGHSIKDIIGYAVNEEHIKSIAVSHVSKYAAYNPGDWWARVAGNEVVFTDCEGFEFSYIIHKVKRVD